MRNKHFRRFIASLLIVAGLWVSPLSAQLASPDTASNPPVRDDLEVLPRGPVHEAFAEPVIFDPDPGIVISKRPPELVEEVPPAEKPEGDDVAWMPGYWAWDDDLDDFIWVSGFWRVVPPGRRWVPGYWAEVTSGFQWVSGFWAPAEDAHVDYLPIPPASLEVGPSIEAPSAQHFWAPGTWQWYETRYVWRPGCWTIAHPNWIWVPSYYVWTPRGCVWVNGYWDYQLGRRGVLYAPVHFRRAAFARVGFSYSPSFIVDMTLLTNHFFVRPNCRHYYYGNYHSSNYLRAGVYPWFTFHSQRRCYDPIYVHHRHHHGHDWDNRLRADYRDRRDFAHSSPGRDFDSRPFPGGTGNSRGRPEHHDLVRSIDHDHTRKNLDLKLEKLEDSRRDELMKHARETQRLAKSRDELERHSKRPDFSIGGDDRSVKLPLPTSSIVRSNRSDHKDAPPRSNSRITPEAVEKARRDFGGKTPLTGSERFTGSERSNRADRPEGRTDSQEPSPPKTDQPERTRPDITGPSGESFKRERPDTSDRESKMSPPSSVRKVPRSEQPRPEKSPSIGEVLRDQQNARTRGQPNSTDREPSADPGRIPGNSREERPQPKVRTPKPSDLPDLNRQERSKRQERNRPTTSPDSSRPGNPIIPRSAPTIAPRTDRPERSMREIKPSAGSTPREVTPRATPQIRTPQVQPRPETRSTPQPRIVPQAQPRPEPRPAPQPRVQVQPRPEIRSAPAGMPRIERNPAPRPEVRSAPAGMPRVERNTPPRAEPRSSPPPQSRPKSNPGSSNRERGDRKK